LHRATSAASSGGSELLSLLRPFNQYGRNWAACRSGCRLRNNIYNLATYREILKRQEGTAFSLPRDPEVWELVKEKFDDNLALLRDLA
jgi:hypothetical protein